MFIYKNLNNKKYIILVKYIKNKRDILLNRLILSQIKYL